RGMLMFAGGGNIGVYAENETIRAAVLRRLRPWQRCLVFPQSALRPEPALLRPGVTVWCRDAVSAAMLQQSGTRTELVPDIALYLDELIPKRPGGEGCFYIKRAPGGDIETIDHGIDFDAPRGDLTWELSLDVITETLAPYEYAVSDRLHGALIALMMRKKVILLPVGYHKTRAFWETWLAAGPGSASVDNPADLPARIGALQPPTRDLAALFRERADPALDRFLLAG